MCGIAGIVLKGNTGQDGITRFEDSVKLMHHRGPDHFGKYFDGRLALFHYRLSIIDLSQQAHQPFTQPNSGDQLIYNGELYNFRELIKNYSLCTETQSDTEVLFQTFQKYGTSILQSYNGIFAFAYFDKSSNSLLLVRDRLGVKPLYYVDNNTFFAFASEAKVLYDYLEKLTLNLQSLHEFMWYGSSISAGTIVKGVKKLEPGGILRFELDSDQYQKETFWSVKENIVVAGEISDNYAEAKRKTRILLDEAVRRQCISDVPIGAYLSGGIDSSVVVALASRYTSGKLNTFSVSFDHNPNSELPLARLIAKRYQTNHYEFEVTTGNLVDDLSAIVFQYDEPFADPAALPLHLMAQQNKFTTKVVLQGDGGDELFAGYGRHLDLTQLRLRQLGSLALSFASFDKSRRHAMKHRSWALNASNPWLRMARQVANATDDNPARIFKGTWGEELSATSPFESYRLVFNELRKLDPLQAMLYTDMQIILPHTYLEKVDKINMMHSIEARVPLLDNQLVQYVMRLPSHFKLRNGTTKSFFREVAEDLLPTEILAGRKVSFGTPMDEWLRTSLYTLSKKLFSKFKQPLGHLIDFDFLLDQLELHKMQKRDNGPLLWRAFVLLVWLDLYQQKIDYGTLA